MTGHAGVTRPGGGVLADAIRRLALIDGDVNRLGADAIAGTFGHFAVHGAVAFAVLQAATSPTTPDEVLVADALDTAAAVVLGIVWTVALELHEQRLTTTAGGAA
jgi:hypothetical protein